MGVAPGACSDPEHSEGEWVGNAILDAYGAHLFKIPSAPAAPCRGGRSNNGHRVSV